MDTYLLSLSGIGLADSERAGAKAAALGALITAGFLAPDGFCLQVDAFRLALEPYEHALMPILSGMSPAPSTAAQAAGEINQLLRDMKIPPVVWNELHARISSSMAGRSLAVRSSAVAEDLPDVSFAGLYASVIGVRGEQALYDAVITCWRSYFSAGALLERVRQNRPEDFGMAVLFQPVLKAECSGVSFTIDPVVPESQRVMVSAAWGLGLGIVDGSVTGDTWWLDRRRQSVAERRITTKSQQIVLDKQGNLETLPVPETLQALPCLPDTWLERIAQQALAAEALLGCPQDVEWAVEDEHLWLLQSRPIASLKPGECPPEPFPVTWERVEDRARLWHLDGPGEPDGKVMLPLELDEFLRVEQTRGDICRYMGADRNLSWLLAGGRLYSAYEPTGLSDADLRLRKMAFDDLYDRLYRQNMTGWDHYGPEIIQISERLSVFSLESAGRKELAAYLEDALAARRWRYVIHPMIRFRPGKAFFNAFEVLTGVTGQAAETAAYQLVFREESVLTRLMDAVYELAVTARDIPGLPALIADLPPDIMEQIEMLEGTEHFLEQMHDFLNQYGERNGAGYGSEATLMTPTWREKPEEILQLSAQFLDPGPSSPAERRRAARAARDRHLDEICSDADTAVVADFLAHLDYAGRLQVGLEDHNHYIDQLSRGQLRRAVLVALDCLFERGCLASAGDGFWLTFDEILSGLRDDSAKDFSSLAAQRKAEYSRWELLSAPTLLGLPDFHLPARTQTESENVESMPGIKSEDTVVSGQGASSGTVRGRARLVLDNLRMPRVSAGDVLVAVNAGPVLTPLFAVLGAVVLDEGSLGQHAASTAREYGIPAVIATRDATRRIADGDWVTVDGTLGRVVIEKQAEMDRS